MSATQSYRTLYRDASGELATTITNDGNTLRMSLGGVDFEGSDFEGFAVVRSETAEALARFTMAPYDLCSCSLEFAMPVTLVTEEGEQLAYLEARLTIGPPDPRGGHPGGQLSLTLVVGALRIGHETGGGWFEQEFLEIAKALPSGWFLKTCFGCAWSDYWPAGTSNFGSMTCYRNNQSGYLAVRSKRDLFQLARGQTVQETHLCPEFERRKPGTGYRG